MQNGRISGNDDEMEDVYMKKNLITLIVVFGMFFYVQSALSKAQKWDIDKAHSNIYFSVDHIFSKVNGHFNDFTVEVNFDAKDLTGSSINFEIDTASVNTNIVKRDKHLQSGDFFDSRKYPKMIFTSTQISDAGNNVYNVAGKLTVKGKEYDFTIPLTLAGIKKHPAVKGKKVIGFNGKINIDRLSYGVGNGKFFEFGVVGQYVETFVSLEFLSDI